MSSSLLAQLLARGDYVAIERGRLVIHPASGRPVPDSWLAENQDRLIYEVLMLAGMDVFRYVGHKVGQYGERKSPGVTLQMTTVLTNDSRYSIFNVSTKRKRNSSKAAAGTQLPKGRFIPPEGGEFVRFWKETGLPLRSCSEIYKSMGRLKEILCIGRVIGEKVFASTLTPLTITADTLCDLVASTSLAGTIKIPREVGGKQVVSKRLVSGKQAVTPSGKETQEGQQLQGLQQDSGAGPVYYGKEVIRECGYTGIPSLSEEEWEHCNRVWTDPEDLKAAIDLGWGDVIFGAAGKGRKT